MEKIKLDSYLPQFIKLNSRERGKILMSIHIFDKNMSLLTQDKIKIDKGNYAKTEIYMLKDTITKIKI